MHLKKNILGIDVNSKCFAVSVVSPEGKVLHQDYFGKDIWQRRKELFERKSRLRDMTVETMPCSDAKNAELS